MIVRHIYLSWRKAKGHKRHMIGELKRSVTNGVSFNYLPTNVAKAREEGFKDYPGIPYTERKITENVLELFSLRLIQKDRSDRKEHFAFWEASESDDDFDLLALTQGLLPTDNFEFLGVFNPVHNFTFITDIANLTKMKLSRDFVKMGESLDYELEIHNPHDFDLKAVKVLTKNGQEIGYIKQIHNRIFFQARKKLNLSIKALDQNGVIKDIFVKVEVK